MVIIFKEISLITGGLGGIGEELVKMLVRESKCVVIDKREVKNRISGVEYLKIDITNPNELLILREYLSNKKFKIKHFIHTAAIGHYKRFEETETREWKHVLRTNLEGTLAVTQTILPFIVEGARIIYFSSGTVFKGTENLASYVASKAGVIGFARSLSMELGERNITVNVIAPGMTDTDLIKDMLHTEPLIIASRALKRKASPIDLVGPVKFLLSDDAQFITGQTLVVDGGSIKN